MYGTQNRPGSPTQDRTDEAADRDPYGILDDVDFLDDWGADTIEEALAKAEEAPSTTDYDYVRRCPACFSARVVSKCGWTNSPKQKPGDLKCDSCGHHFTETAPILADVREHVVDGLERGAAHGAVVALAAADSLHDLADELADGLSVLR